MKRIAGLRVGLVGLAIAAFGAVIGFIAAERAIRWLSLLAFGTTAFGIAVGFVGIIYGSIKTGRTSIKGGIPAARDLSNMIKRRLRR